MRDWIVLLVMLSAFVLLLCITDKVVPFWYAVWLRINEWYRWRKARPQPQDFCTWTDDPDDLDGRWAYNRDKFEHALAIWRNGSPRRRSYR